MKKKPIFGTARGNSYVTKELEQTGTRKSIKRDAGRQALPSGKRTTAWGTVYWETRKNRSDAKNSKI